MNLDYYLNQKLDFITTTNEYPIACLRGNENVPTITLNFNHCKSEKEAKDNWERRKKRINRDNLYVIFYNLDGITLEQIKSMEQFQCNNKIILTSVKLPDIPWAHYIKPNFHQKYPYSYLGRDVFGVRFFEKKFDFVSFLNTKN